MNGVVIIKELRLVEKSDYLALFNMINRPLLKYYTKNKARIIFGQTGVGYGCDKAGIEGFSRVLWGAGPGISNIGAEWQTFIVEGIAAGTDPDNFEYWGKITARDQRMVEMPAIALTLLYDEKFIWNQFTQKQKNNITSWLLQIFYHDCPDGNWQFFKVIVGVVLKKLDVQVEGIYIEEALTKIEACYLEDGWYRDSSRGRLDYYNPFAFHYYGLIYSVLLPEDERSVLYRERAASFAKEYLHFFSSQGSNIPFGRSMIYRHAAVSFWVALVYADVMPVELGIIKGIINRNLSWWFTKTIFDDNQLLSLGYTYPQQTLTEPYNSGLSPYWSNKIFLLLALPTDHDYWKVEEKAMPVRESEVYVLKSPQMLAVHDKEHSFLLNGGQMGPNYHTLSNEKYLKFAYSSHFGFSVPRTNQVKEEAAMDSMIGVQSLGTTVLTSRNGQNVEEVGPLLTRHRVENNKITDDFVSSVWKANNEIRIKTWLTALSGWQIRIHKVNLKSPTYIYETGFAIENSPDCPGLITSDKEGHFFIGDKGFSGIADLSLGTATERKKKSIDCLPNTNLMTCETTFLPGLEVELSRGTHWLITAVYAHSDSVYARDKWLKKPIIKFCGDEIIVSLDEKQSKIIEVNS